MGRQRTVSAVPMRTGGRNLNYRTLNTGSAEFTSRYGEDGARRVARALANLEEQAHRHIAAVQKRQSWRLKG